MMFLLAKNALSGLKIRNIQQIMARQNHMKCSLDFHEKYGNAVLASGAAFCVVTWGFLTTQMGIEWNLSPVGRVTPMQWNEE
ncbi:cytochrome c oxidase subunit 7B2, mitochondrial [Ochotona princeps]|uniref:cytochrome c oxidase subunit 7B2, mitochondrial n=1 Tax=Ochotona princeps TaxID=9978 RepID=UPI00032B2773|nr:cytochrome c oxidase subunit 7B2, mitochondrial [Ochotona princeps]XP_058526128.1 cytochrome c oxidase subunit 7B2, mitochondrial [Ochotona princeps]